MVCTYTLIKNKINKQSIAHLWIRSNLGYPGFLMLVINVLFLALCLLVCDASNSQLRKRNVGSKPAALDEFCSEIVDEPAQTSLLKDENEEPSQSGYFDFLFSFAVSVSGITTAVGEADVPSKIVFKAPRDDSEAVTLATRTISGYEAVLLAPALLEHRDHLRSALARIKTAETVIAAFKLRSLVPKLVIDSQPKKYFDEWNSEYSYKEEAEELAPTTSTKILNDLLVTLMKPLPEESKVSIQGMPVDRLDGFVAEKEEEIEYTLFKSTAAICELKRLLYSSSPTLSTALTSGWLALIVAKLDLIHESYETLRGYQKEEFEQHSGKMPYGSNVPWHRYKTGKAIQVLSSVLEEL